MIISEVIKKISYQTKQMPFYFYRTSHVVEVDLVVEKNSKTFTYEIKCSKTLSKDMGEGIRKFYSKSSSR